MYSSELDTANGRAKVVMWVVDGKSLTIASGTFRLETLCANATTTAAPFDLTHGMAVVLSTTGPVLAAKAPGSAPFENYQTTPSCVRLRGKWGDQAVVVEVPGDYSCRGLAHEVARHFDINHIGLRVFQLVPRSDASPPTTTTTTPNELVEVDYARSVADEFKQQHHDKAIDFQVFDTFGGPDVATLTLRGLCGGAIVAFHLPDWYSNAALAEKVAWQLGVGGLDVRIDRLLREVTTAEAARCAPAVEIDDYDAGIVDEFGSSAANENEEEEVVHFRARIYPFPGGENKVCHHPMLRLTGLCGGRHVVRFFRRRTLALRFAAK